jgi:hypothetical protein
MKNLPFLIAGIAAAFVAYVIAERANARRPIPVEELAHRLEDAWADHHTVA